MITVLVWLAIINGAYGTTAISPPLATLADCQRIQKNTEFKTVNCVQVNILIK